MSNLSLIGQMEPCQWKSTKTDTIIGSKSQHQYMLPLQKFIIQWKQQRNGWDQNREVLTCVYYKHAKFHDHTVPYEHFSINLPTYVTQACSIGQQKWKITIKLKKQWTIPQKFT